MGRARQGRVRRARAAGRSARPGSRPSRCPWRPGTGGGGLVARARRRPWARGTATSRAPGCARSTASTCPSAPGPPPPSWACRGRVTGTAAVRGGAGPARRRRGVARRHRAGSAGVDAADPAGRGRRVTAVPGPDQAARAAAPRAGRRRRARGPPGDADPARPRSSAWSRAGTATPRSPTHWCWASRRSDPRRTHARSAHAPHPGRHRGLRWRPRASEGRPAARSLTAAVRRRGPWPSGSPRPPGRAACGRR